MLLSCHWDANPFRVRIDPLVQTPYRLRYKMNSDTNQTLINTNNDNTNVFHLYTFFMFSYMFIILFVSNISVGTIRTYRRSLPYLRINIILILNSYLAETFNAVVTVVVIMIYDFNLFSQRWVDQILNPTWNEKYALV